MLLEEIVLCDVGNYRGENQLKLVPVEGKSRPIVLIGGLNGSGKTTLLDSIRLALYGRASLPSGTSQRAYEDHLRGLIHRGGRQVVQPDRAYVQLRFTYSRMGKKLRYCVGRSWVAAKGVSETLSVTQDGDGAPVLEGDSAQAFLTQLLPSGVSQFFFFDGEKIGELARDESGGVLADSIRRLLGLDVADRLRSDLVVYQRAQRSMSTQAAELGRLQTVYAEIDALKSEVAQDEARSKDYFLPAIAALGDEVHRKRGLLADRGGAWSVNRAQLEQELRELSERKLQLEQDVREALVGPCVFAISARLNAAVAAETAKADAALHQKQALEALSAAVPRLKKKLAGVLEDAPPLAKKAAGCVDEWLVELSPPLSERVMARQQLTISPGTRDLLTTQAPAAALLLRNMFARLSEATARITELQDKLAHAPTDEAIGDVLAEYEAAAQKLASVRAEHVIHLNALRVKIGKLVELLRRARKVEEQVDSSGTGTRAQEYANRLLSFISEFKQTAAAAKCKSLEAHFISAFKRLARKSEIQEVRIDPVDFTVVLIDKTGHEVPKKQLSAGEKQVFAIAMLEALARTSGRSLPIIIDTPLGRLDSQHRHKLVHAYLPTASHQVLVLSTDTEVDESFYQGLRPHISHAYHLEFDSVERCTRIMKGYFWKKQETLHAA